MKINWEQLGQQMLTAAADVLKTDWPTVAPYAAGEFASYLNDLRLIDTFRQQGELTEAEAVQLAGIAQASMQTVLLAVEGVGLLAVEQAVNAAVGVVRQAVNTAVGFAFL